MEPTEEVIRRYVGTCQMMVIGLQTTVIDVACGIESKYLLFVKCQFVVVLQCQNILNFVG